MLPYYIFFGFFGILAMFDYVKQDSNVQIIKKRSLIFGVFLILFFVGFRYKLASDWLAYTNWLNASPDIWHINFDNVIEPGFNILLALFKTFNLNFEILAFAITLFNTISLFSFLKRNNIRNNMTLLSIILILNVFKEFDILRQSLAFYIILFIFSNKPIKSSKYFIICIVATCFHYTAIIFIIYYLFLKINLTRRKIVIIGALYFASLFFTIPVLSFLIPLLPEFDYVIKAQILMYVFDFQRDISFSTVVNSIFLIILIIYFKRLKNLSYSEIYLIKFFLFYVIIFVFCKEIREVSDRLSYYFAIGLAFMFSLLPILLPVKNIKLYLFVLPLIYISMKLSLHSKQEATLYGITPYRNYIFKSQYSENDIMKRYYTMQGIAVTEIDRKK